MINCLLYNLQETILCSLLPEDCRTSLIHLTAKNERFVKGSKAVGTEAILSWVLQVLIKPGHAVDQCEKYVEKFEPLLLSTVCAHHLKFYRAHITCLLEHYMVAFQYVAPNVTAEELLKKSSWVSIGLPAKCLDLLTKNLKALLQQNQIMHDATILKIQQHLCLT